MLNGFCYVGCYLFQLLGLMYAPSVLSGVMMATVPIWTEIIARIFLKEKTSAIQNLFLFLSTGAVIAMLLIGSTDSVRGFDIRGIVLLSATFLMEALNGVIIRSLKEEYTPSEISFASCVISLGISLAILAIQMGFHAVEIPDILSAFVDGKFVAAILFLGLFGTFSAGILKGYMLQHMSALRAMVWFNAGTPAAVLAGVLFLREPFYFYQCVCTVLILVGVVGTQVCKKGNV